MYIAPCGMIGLKPGILLITWYVLSAFVCEEKGK